MPKVARIGSFIVLLGLLASVAAGSGRAADQPGRFDYYLLNLSWSPQFCATPAGDKPSNAAQCGTDRRFGFVVHGLWPQYANGRWPESCSTERVGDPTIDGMQDIMPSRGLVIHEWRKHGTCSGLGADAYFRQVRATYDRVRIPDRFQAPTQPIITSKADIVAAFLAVNPDMPKDAIAVKCARGQVEEVAICFDREAKTPQACGKLRYKCDGDSVRMQGVR